MIEEAINNLAEAMNRVATGLEKQAEALNVLNNIPTSSSDEPADTKPATKKKATRKKAAKEEPAVEPTKVQEAVVSTQGADGNTTSEPANTTTTAPAKEEVPAEPVQTADQAPAEALSAEKVQAHLRSIGAQLTDTTKLFGLITELGADTFSGLDPSTYPTLVERADALLAAEKAGA